MSRKVFSLQSIVIDQARRFSDRIALSMYRRGAWDNITYAELYRRSLNQAGVFRKDGCRGNIMLIGESCPEWGISFFSILHSGAAAVPLDPKLTKSEITSLVLHAEPSSMIVSRIQYEKLSLENHSFPSVKKIYFLEEVGKDSSSALRRPAIRTDEDLALIAYTSGTTGSPKGVMVPYRAFNHQLRTVTLSIGDHDRFLSILPLNHLYELTSGFLISLAVGGEVIYSGSLLPQDIFFAAKEKSITGMVVVPLFLNNMKASIERELAKQSKRKQAIFKKMLQFFSRTPLRFSNRWLRKLVFAKIHKKFGSQFRGFYSGGAPLEDSVGSFFDAIGFEVMEGYGLSETAPCIAINPRWKAKFGTVGTILPEIEHKIEVDGELKVRGPNVMVGYFKSQELTQQVLDSEGWLSTGDIVKMSETGYLTIAGRKKNLIVLAGGKKIHPEEVEFILAQSPHVKELCVLEIPKVNGEGLEVVCVVVKQPESVLVPSDLEQDLRKRAQDLAEYKRPSRYIITPFDLPRTATLKVKRAELQGGLKVELKKPGGRDYGEHSYA